MLLFYIDQSSVKRFKQNVKFSSKDIKDGSLTFFNKKSTHLLWGLIIYCESIYPSIVKIFIRVKTALQYSLALYYQTQHCQ